MHHRGYEKKFPLSLTASVSKVAEIRKTQERRLFPVSQSLNSHLNASASRESFAPELGATTPRGKGDNVSTYLFSQRRRSMRRPTVFHEHHGELITQSSRHSMLTRSVSGPESEHSDKDKKARTNLIKSLRKQHSVSILHSHIPV